MSKKFEKKFEKKQKKTVLETTIQTTIRTIFLWLFWVGIWHSISVLINNSLILPGPLATFNRLFHLGGTKDFWWTIFTSLSKIYIGFFLGLVAGTLLAIIASRFRWVFDILQPFFYVVRATPVVSFAVLFLLWVTSKHISVVISFSMVLPIIYNHIYTGIKEVDKELLEMALIFRVPMKRQIKGIYIHALLPHFFAAFETALGFAFKSGVAAEVIGLSQQTIGYEMYHSKILLDTESLFAWTATVILISFITEKVLHLLFERSRFYAD